MPPLPMSASTRYEPRSSPMRASGGRAVAGGTAQPFSLASGAVMVRGTWRGAATLVPRRRVPLLRPGTRIRAAAAGAGRRPRRPDLPPRQAGRPPRRSLVALLQALEAVFQLLEALLEPAGAGQREVESAVMPGV